MKLGETEARVGPTQRMDIECIFNSLNDVLNAAIPF